MSFSISASFFSGDVFSRLFLVRMAKFTSYCLRCRRRTQSRFVAILRNGRAKRLSGVCRRCGNKTSRFVPGKKAKERKKKRAKLRGGQTGGSIFAGAYPRAIREDLRFAEQLSRRNQGQRGGGGRREPRIFSDLYLGGIPYRRAPPQRV